MLLQALGLTAQAPLAALLVIGAMLVAFMTERLPPATVAIGGMAAVLILGLVDTEGMLRSMGNNAPWTIVPMFIVSGALVRTGVLTDLGEQLGKIQRFGKTITIAAFLAVVIGASAFMNNTPLVVMLIPVTVTLANTLGMSASRLLMPLSFAAILGGTCTLIGTSTNLLVDGVAMSKGLPGFSLFDITPVGLLVAIGGGLYMAIAARYLLPNRSTVADSLNGRPRPSYLVEVLVPHDSPFIGKTPDEVSLFSGPDRRVLDVLRGDVSLRRNMSAITLLGGDIVVLKTNVADLLSIKDGNQVELRNTSDIEAIGTRTTSVVEVLLTPGARLIGMTLGDARLRRRYGVYPFALHRHGENLSARLEQLRLKVGDTLLVDGAPDDIARLARDMALINVNAPSERAYRRSKSPLALIALLAIVVVSGLGWMPIAGLAWIGVAFVMLTGCIDMDEAVQAVDWSIILLILSMLVVGKGLEDSGAVQLIVNGTAPFLAELPPIALLAMIFVLASALTEVVTNNAVAVVVTPVAIGLATSLGLDPRPFIVVVMFAASASFATPIGYQTNTLVYSAGGYRFSDFIKIGLPLNVISGLISVPTIALIWPP